MKGITACVLILLLLLTPTIFAVYAIANSSFGGKTGDWIDYSFQNAVGLSTYYLRIDFLNVSGSNVTFRAAVYTQTLTFTNDTYTLNLNSQEDAHLTPDITARICFVPGGLSTNDSVYLGDLGDQTIKGETTRSYLGVSRAVVYANFSDTINTYLLYWDKETGALTEYTRSLANESSGVASLDFVVDDTNMWTSPIPLLVWISIIVAIALGILSSSKIVRKRFNKKQSAQNASKTTFAPISEKRRVNRNARFI